MRNLILSFTVGISLAFGASATPRFLAGTGTGVPRYLLGLRSKRRTATPRVRCFSPTAQYRWPSISYAEMMTADFGKQISSIALEELDAEDLARIDEVMPTPDGGSARLAPKPYKKLVIKIDTSDTSGTSSTTSSTFVAEQDGRLGVSMPVPAN
jgi:hypothetical protein